MQKACFLFCSFIVLLLIGSSCGYRSGSGEALGKYSTIYVPYVEGDRKGFFTTALIRSLSARSTLISAQGGALCLYVCLDQPEDDNIGFAYAPEEGRNEVSNIVVSNEARLSLTAHVSLIDRVSGSCLLGPFEITSYVDYDFEPDLTDVQAHELSLGQLEMNNLAQDAAFLPLYARLAEKIVDYLLHSW